MGSGSSSARKRVELDERESSVSRDVPLVPEASTSTAPTTTTLSQGATVSQGNMSVGGVGGGGGRSGNNPNFLSTDVAQVSLSSYGSNPNTSSFSSPHSRSLGGGRPRSTTPGGNRSAGGKKAWRTVASRGGPTCTEADSSFQIVDFDLGSQSAPADDEMVSLGFSGSGLSGGQSHMTKKLSGSSRSTSQGSPNVHRVPPLPVPPPQATSNSSTSTSGTAPTTRPLPQHSHSHVLTRLNSSGSASNDQESRGGGGGGGCNLSGPPPRMTVDTNLLDHDLFVDDAPKGCHSGMIPSSPTRSTGGGAPHSPTSSLPQLPGSPKSLTGGHQISCTPPQFGHHNSALRSGSQKSLLSSNGHTSGASLVSTNQTQRTTTVSTSSLPPGSCQLPSLSSPGGSNSNPSGDSKNNYFSCAGVETQSLNSPMGVPPVTTRSEQEPLPLSFAQNCNK